MFFKNMSYSEYINSKGTLPNYEYYDWDSRRTTKYTDSDKIYNLNDPDPGHEIWTDSNVLLIKESELNNFKNG
jgi:hypothetical protein